ncbi:AAA family ATPase [uncultured Microscilla sp.]|uniref:AAA family ATPase n=1 Tax=uncultured Microscilla sp. TaxID=432653 RepID=UPI0026123EE8|nr:AAA family ATPase [uncultured Microscilla sp.]
MKILEYPLVCWQLTSGAIFGQLLGYSQQVVADDVKSLKASFSEYIEKQMKDSWFYEPEIGNTRIKTISMDIRPHYQESDRIYPVKETLEVKIDAVYGSNESGYYECFLPLLHKNFYFYNEKDLDRLVEHFSRDTFHALTPDDIYNLLIPATPWLEQVKVKIPKRKKEKSQSGDYKQFKLLNGIAEKLPYSRKENRKGTPDAAWERGETIDHLINIMIAEKTNVLLVGKSGVGKSAVIHEAIRKVTSQQKSKDFFERNSFWRTTPSRITSKAKYLGEWQLICEDMVYQLEGARGILWLESFVMLALTGGEGPEDSVAAFLTSFIRRGKLRIVSEVTPEELEVMRRMIPGFIEHFRILKIDEMDTQTTLKLFEYFNQYINKRYSVAFTPKAQEMAYVLLDRFIKYESFPGKAIRFLMTCANKAMQDKELTIDLPQIIDNFTRQSGIPDFLLRDDLFLNEVELKDFFKEKIKGQDHVVDKVSDIIKVFKAGLNDPNKPVATMIFAGPTGVGKTATVKAISSYFFGKGQAYEPLIRLDMSEFQHPSQIYRLIGSQGKLIQHVRQKPFSVLLLDEIEKANPLIFDALLTVLDEGILLDAAGRLTDFRNTIIIMTSNLGATTRSSLGFRSYQGHDFESNVKAFFRPEFYNRVDAILVFNPLEKETILSITRKELDEIQKRDGLKQRNINLQFTKNLIEHIGEEGFDPKYGARPLQREIERLIIAPLGHLFIQNPTFANRTITVDYDGKEVSLRY